MSVPKLSLNTVHIRDGRLIGQRDTHEANQSLNECVIDKSVSRSHKTWWKTILRSLAVDTAFHFCSEPSLARIGNAPSGHMAFIQRRLNVDATS